MTICVAVAVNDGLIFAADSASTVSVTDANGQTQIHNVYNHGQKVYNLYRGLPLVAMTCGRGNFGDSSIAALAKELRYSLSHGTADDAINRENYTVAEVVEKTKKFLFDERFCALEPRPTDPFEFWVGGYPSAMGGKFELWKIIINQGECAPPVQLAGPGIPGLWWGGAISPIARLVLGFDHTLEIALAKAFGAGGAAPDSLEARQLRDLIAVIRSQSEVYLHSPVMPIQDAIGLAEFLVDTGKRFFKYLPGADIVGGDTDVAVVTRHEGFKWIRRKHYYPANLNPLEIDHV